MSGETPVQQMEGALDPTLSIAISCVLVVCTAIFFWWTRRKNIRQTTRLEQAAADHNIALLSVRERQQRLLEEASRAEREKLEQEKLQRQQQLQRQREADLEQNKQEELKKQQIADIAAARQRQQQQLEEQNPKAVEAGSSSSALPTIIPARLHFQLFDESFPESTVLMDTLTMKLPSLSTPRDIIHHILHTGLISPRAHAALLSTPSALSIHVGSAQSPRLKSLDQKLFSVSSSSASAPSSFSSPIDIYANMSIEYDDPLSLTIMGGDGGRIDISLPLSSRLDTLESAFRTSVGDANDLEYSVQFLFSGKKLDPNLISPSASSTLIPLARYGLRKGSCVHAVVRVIKMSNSQQKQPARAPVVVEEPVAVPSPPSIPEDIIPSTPSPMHRLDEQEPLIAEENKDDDNEDVGSIPAAASSSSFSAPPENHGENNENEEEEQSNEEAEPEVEKEAEAEKEEAEETKEVEEVWTLHLQDVYRRKRTVQVAPSARVGELRQMVLSASEYNEDAAQDVTVFLVVKGKRLNDDEAAVRDTGLVDGDVIYFILKNNSVVSPLQTPKSPIAH